MPFAAHVVLRYLTFQYRHLVLSQMSTNQISLPRLPLPRSVSGAGTSSHTQMQVNAEYWVARHLRYSAIPQLIRGVPAGSRGPQSEGLTLPGLGR